MSHIAPGTVIGQYRILEQIGRGGMATVYRAHQASLDRDVAIKILPSFFAEESTFLERFRIEARVIAQFRHPNILTVFDYGEDHGLTYVVTEYVTAGTLERRMTKPLPLEFAANIASQIGSALDYAHSRGVLHRDVKPSNILMTEDGTAVLADFGMARILSVDHRLTTSGMFLGTPEYMAPEQALDGPVDHRCDVYSLGVVLYEMLVGSTPFTAESPTALIFAHVQQPLPPPRSRNPDLPQEVEAVLLKALAKDPAARHQSAGELAAALEAAITPQPRREAGPAPPSGGGPAVTSYPGAQDEDAADRAKATGDPTAPAPPAAGVRTAEGGLPEARVDEAAEGRRGQTSLGDRRYPDRGTAVGLAGAKRQLLRGRRKVLWAMAGAIVVAGLAVGLWGFAGGGLSGGGAAWLTARPASARLGTTFTVAGGGFASGEEIKISIAGPRPVILASLSASADRTGRFSLDWTPPAGAGAGEYQVSAQSTRGQKASTKFTVTPR